MTQSETFTVADKLKAGAARNIAKIFNLAAESSMSFNNTAREDFWQSTSRNTISERCEAIFNQEILSDVKFVVRDSQGGSQNKTIPAHKFVLAISSPVFYAMFYGEMAETKVVRK